MKIKRLLLLHKRSAYNIYFSSAKSSLYHMRGLIYKSDLERFKKTHREHYTTLKLVEESLKKKKIPYTKMIRGSTIDYTKFDFVLTVGGDGTFLDAAHHILHQPILGVNSDTAWSVGRLCTTDRTNFEKIFDKYLSGKAKVDTLNRLAIKFRHHRINIQVVNDLLVTHENPAAMSRYCLSIGTNKEEHRSSGVWISTAVGSSGAIYSAKGKLLNHHSAAWQYMPRELYHRKDFHYQLTGSVLTAKQTLKVISLMRQGAVFIDGAHVKLPFSYGMAYDIFPSHQPLHVIAG